MILQAGLSSQRIRCVVLDSEGAPYTDADHNSLSLSYLRDGAASATSISLSAGTVGTYSSGGVAHVAGGVYELGIPDAAIESAGGVGIRVWLTGSDSSGATVVPMLIDLVSGTYLAELYFGLYTRMLDVFDDQGVWDGGVNTMQSWLQALARKDVTVPTNLGGTYDPADHSQEAIAGGVSDGLAITFPQSALDQLSGIGTFSPLVLVNQITQAITLVEGDDYINALGRALTFSIASGESWPTDLSVYTPHWSYRDADGTTIATVEGSIVTATGDDRTVRFDVTAADVADAGDYVWDIQFTDGSGNKWTPRLGNLTIVKDASP